VGHVSQARLKLVSPPSRAFRGDDAELVRAAQAGDRAARVALYERHGDHVERVLSRVLGFQRDLDDLHHDVFVRALASLGNIDEPAALKGWLTRIAVHVALETIDRRRRRRWLWFLPDHELPEVTAVVASGEVRDALAATYAVLGRLPADERVAFALRFIDGMELTEVAAACETSLATIKRRLARASARFEAAARREPALVPWLEGGTRWNNPSER
jgi:RNA polymerase sigma-70 factor (ECF subfamily)